MAFTSRSKAFGKPFDATLKAMIASTIAALMMSCTVSVADFVMRVQRNGRPKGQRIPQE
jgi:hypothetical protein